MNCRNIMHVILWCDTSVWSRGKSSVSPIRSTPNIASFYPPRLLLLLGPRINLLGRRAAPRAFSLEGSYLATCVTMYIRHKYRPHAREATASSIPIPVTQSMPIQRRPLETDSNSCYSYFFLFLHVHVVVHGIELVIGTRKRKDGGMLHMLRKASCRWQRHGDVSKELRPCIVQRMRATLGVE